MNIKTKIKKTPVYGIKSYKEKEFYVTADGKEFENFKEAEKWEFSLDVQKKKDFLWESIKKINCDDVDLLDYGDRWYLIENDEQLEILKNAAGFYDKYNNIIVSGDWKIGEWVTWQFDDGGDYRGTNYCYTFSYVKNEIDKFLNKFEEFK
jgi:hypothetical protein